MNSNKNLVALVNGCKVYSSKAWTQTHGTKLQFHFKANVNDFCSISNNVLDLFGVDYQTSEVIQVNNILDSIRILYEDISAPKDMAIYRLPTIDLVFHLSR